MRPTLFLCSGLQSSGSTLVSWCFLQRGDMNGVLDAEPDLLPQIDAKMGQPHVWYKTTVSCFGLRELTEYYRDQHWEVRPLLVIRDLRPCWASFQGKPYARNGITAEDPPFRMRVRRFLEDWEFFRRMDWPTLRYESLLQAPEATLREACRKLELPWDSAMLDWPKPDSQIADANWGNASFWNTRGKSLSATIGGYQSRRQTQKAPSVDVSWLLPRFADFNRENGYPDWESSPGTGGGLPAESVPRFDVTRRYLWETRHKPMRWLLSLLGVANRPLIERRSLKVARERLGPIAGPAAKTVS